MDQKFLYQFLQNSKLSQGMSFPRLSIVQLTKFPNTKLDLWIKYFTTSFSKSNSLISKFPAFKTIERNLPSTIYKKKDTKQQNEQNLAKIFKFSNFEHINDYSNLFSFLEENIEVLSSNDCALFEPLFNHMYRNLIQYSYLMAEIFHGKNELLENVLVVFRVFFQMPKENVKDAYQLLTYIFVDFIKSLTNEYSLISTNQSLINFFDQITIIILPLIDQNDGFINIEMHQYLLAYCLFFTRFFGSPLFLNHMNSILKVLVYLLKVNPSITNLKDTNILFMSILDIAAFTLSNFPVPQTDPNSLQTNLNENNSSANLTPAADFYRFNSFLISSLLTIIEKCPDLYQKCELLDIGTHMSKFIIWIMKEFPIESMNSVTSEISENEESLIPKSILDSLLIKKPPVYEFIPEMPNIKITKSFKELVEESQNFYPEKGQENLKNIPKLEKFIHAQVETKNDSPLIKLFISKLEPLVFAEANQETTFDALIIYFFVHILLASSKNTQIYIFSNFNLLPQLTNLFIFKPKYLNKEEQLTDELILYKNIRLSIATLIINVFSKSNQPEALHYIVNSLKTEPIEVADYYMSLIRGIYMVNMPNFLLNLPKFNILENIVDYAMKLQALLLYYKNDENKAFKINKYRHNLLLFFTSMTLEANSKYCLFTTIKAVALIFHHCFERSFTKIAIEFILNGLIIPDNEYNINNSEKSPFIVIIPLTINLLKVCVNEKSDSYLELALSFMRVLRHALTINRKMILPVFINNKFTNFLLTLPSQILSTCSNLDEDKIELRYKLLNQIIFVIFGLTKGSNEIKELLSKPLNKLAAFLSTIKLKNDTIEAILQLIFEHPISLSKFPDSIEIQYTKALSFLHISLINNANHAIVFNFIARIAQKSFSNRLHIYQSKLPTLIIKYVVQFDDYSKIPESKKASIDALLKVFQVVSSCLFKPQTFVETLKALKNKNNEYRPWYVYKILDVFDHILKTDFTNAPSSFFHFNGTKSGILIPKINLHQNQGSWSFMCRFELDDIFNENNIFQPRLLSITSSTDKSKLHIFFDQKKLCLLIENELNVVLFKDFINFTFAPGEWYTFGLTFYGKIVKIFINGQKVFSETIKQHKFENSFENFTVANYFDLNNNNNFGLVCNMSCIYFFSSKITKNLIIDITSLPIEYIYSFTPSNRNLFPLLPSSLFNGDLENNLEFCYNARICDGLKCTNLKPNSNIGSANIYGHIVPFNSSFVGAIIQMGGMKTLLPLLDQVDLASLESVENQDSQKLTIMENRKFFMTLLDVFYLFNRQSEEIGEEFCKSEGIKALAWGLSLIKYCNWSDKAFCALKNFYLSIRSENFKIEMIQTIWLNFHVWRSFPPDYHQDLIDFAITQVFNDNNKLFVSSINFTQLLAMILSINSDHTRQIYWNFLINYAKVGFSSNEQATFFRLDQSKFNTETKLTQAMQALYKIVKSMAFDCHLLLINPVFYSNFINFSQSKSEVVRFLAIKFLCITCNLCEKELLGQSPLPLDQSILIFVNSIISSHIKNNLGDNLNQPISEYSWKKLTKFLFRYPKRFTELLPLLSLFSYYSTPKLIDEFAIMLLEKLNNDCAFCEFITSSLNWCQNLFYVYLQSCIPLDFSNESNFIKIFSNIFTYLLIKGKIKIFKEGIISLMLIQYFTKFDVSSTIRLIFIEILKNTRISSGKKNGNNSNVINDNIAEYLASEVFLFLFMIPSYEIYYENLELISKYDSDLISWNETSIKKSIVSILNEKIQYDQFISYHENQINEIYASFNLRITTEGFWIDSKLSEEICNFLANGHFDSIQIGQKSYKMIEIYTLIVMLQMRSYGKNITDILPSKIPILKYPNSENWFNSLSLIIYFSFPTLKNNTDSIKLFNKLLNDNSKILGKKSDNNLLNIALENAGEKACEILNSLSSKMSNLITLIQKQFITISQNYINTRKLNKIISKQTMKNDDILNQFSQIMSSTTISCAKAYKHLWRDVMTSIGPWRSETDPTHWKLNQYLDMEYRHIFMKPNRDFNDHSNTSTCRDEGNRKTAIERMNTILIENAKVNIIESNNFESNDVDVEKDANNENEAENENENEDIIDINELESNSENDQMKNAYVFETHAVLVTVIGNYVGTLSMNSHEILFTGIYEDENNQFTNSNTNVSHNHGKLPQNGQKTIQISFNFITMILLRNYLHIKSAFEIFIAGKRSYFFFLPRMDRKKVIRFLSRKKMPKLNYIQTNPSANLVNEFKITEKWQKGEITNYQYLIFLNIFAGRSFNDLSQYPVFPWILSNYTSEKLDLLDPTNFRDLSKPIGALNEERLANLEMACENRPEMDLPPFLYRLHYSTAYFVSTYLVRVEPYTSVHIKMQGGKFDIKDRLFRSLDQFWHAVTSILNDFRELIPELFTTPEIFYNQNNFNLGSDDLNNVKLPPWASSPYDFIAKHREALESDYVSIHLNEWIDLIFGYKQTGPEAVKSKNTFHPYSYSSYLTNQVLKNKEKLRDVQMNILEFGITPRQLFDKNHPHPPRFTEPIIRNISLKLPFGFFQGEQIKMINKFNSKPLFVSGYNKSTIVLTADAQLSILTQSNENENLMNSITSDLSSSIFLKEDSPSKTFCIISNYLIVSSVCDSSFHFFNLSIENGANLVASRQRFSLILALCIAGPNSFITASRDTSLICWIVKDSISMKYRITPHSAAIVDIDTSYQLNLMISADKQNKVIFTRLSDGKYIRSFDCCKYCSNSMQNDKNQTLNASTFENSDLGNTDDQEVTDNSENIYENEMLNSGSFLNNSSNNIDMINRNIYGSNLVMNIVNVKISEALCVLVYMIEKLENDERFVINSYDFHGNLIASRKIESRMISWCQMRRNGISKLVASFEDRSLTVFSLPCIEKQFSMNLSDVATNVEYCYERDKLFIVREDNCVLEVGMNGT
ncbi:hypothetical protein TRFO_31503 [Tritrichomonas foetus]|uniref:Beige/BEACH domain containing protein n=1 Tax=Tritrichomonas foetus TaxID=1144522 RepID=A0A1J4JR28_9EUKA|nr:hypothetical protein TRFO_31503 [Tritrichomonas foetus]|eukprot:OHT01631.1 hypothetical protein TRFO_31503 [Tritrichomonas foetus]